MKKSGLKKYSYLLVPVLFLLFSAPSALDYVFHFPDEKYYTDAVLQMMDKEDCFTPYQANGSPRFKKPILTYWVLMGSYKVFGVSKISSRLFFWLAGAILVLVIYLMSKSISGDKKMAFTAAFITAANPLVLMSASRSIPDILLTLFLTISAWGFIKILNSLKPRKEHFWMAYMGAALAFETKGIPAAAFAGISILFLLFNPWKKKRLNQIFEPFSLIVSILIALSWFIIMYVEHGSVYLNSFFADQVGNRVSSKFAQVFTNLFLGIVFLAAYLIPWIVIVFSNPKALKQFTKKSSLQTKAVFGFILSWVLLVIVMSGAVFKFYDRYLLPVIPLISIFFAYVISFSTTHLKKSIFKIFLIINIFVIGLSLLYTGFIYFDNVLFAGILLNVLLIISWLIGWLKNIDYETKLAGTILLLFFNVFSFLYPLLMPNPGEQLVENLTKQGLSKNEKVYVYGNIRTASNIRIHSKNAFNVVSMDTIYSLPAEPKHFLVFSKKEESFLDLKNYNVTMGSEEWKNVNNDRFPDFLQEPVKDLKEKGTKYFIAKPKEKNEKS
ncbi:phospholipid carrier-dependent glycosyltransferase [Maribellus comscasis]|uniref:Phospholipid carrier-dependent glycosyltransferase n=1 Tax=Maribellus comscasis TaxID=2681766 RepID=A0A6I6JVP2_9BACT|nr:glycosyltransferase family 39 protein [Maribellus comscasis]QGY45369.1 phospholipid carrier-dependent glycosyltransferase [Maribellus comscasis]